MTGPRAPLSVRIDDGAADRHVTGAVRDLRFTKTAPGGFHSASMRLVLPRDAFTDLGPADKVYVYDARTGRTLFEGFTENPGTQDGPDGQGFDLSVMGTTVLTTDESRPLIYVDRDLDNWTAGGGQVPASANREAAEDPTGVSGQGLLCQFQPGLPVGFAYDCPMNYDFSKAQMEFGAISVSFKSGKVDTGYANRLAYGGGFNWTFQTSLGTAVSSANLFVVDHIPAGQGLVALNVERTGGATNVADDNTWTFFFNIAMIGRRMDRYGNLLSGSAGVVSSTYVLASWVAEDLLGRVLTFADKAASRVDATAWQIDQLAYIDGTKASDLLDDLSLWEPDFLWEILQSTPRGYVFNYRAWPTDVRYEISVRDGYDAPGGDVDLCNRIAVYWTDSLGNKQTTVRGASVATLGTGSPVLADGTRNPAYTGRVRDADPITLPDGQGSLVNAQRIGDQVLAAKANPPKAATAVVKRPILDRLTGDTVYPWEIQPGYLVRVRETGDVLRLTEMEYVDNDCAASLTLGTPVLTNDQRIARLSKKVA